MGRVPDPVSERRLDELRERADREGAVMAGGVRPSGAPFPQATPDAGYYGLPLLKRPVWTWEVPVYFFVGGLAGGAAIIAAAAHAAGAQPHLARDARRMAATGGLLSPVLLIADLGRPERFLNMLRVLKPQSPMSVGAWTLVVFSNSTIAGALADWLAQTRNRQAGFGQLLRALFDAVAAGSGGVMATYTGVLIGATAIPAWAENIRTLPAHFGASGIGSAASLLELVGHDDQALNVIAAGAAVAETAAAWKIERDERAVSDPLRHGASGALIRIAALLAGPVPLAVRVFGRRSPAARKVAAVATLAGSLLTRFGWMQAGRASADDPRTPLALVVDGTQR